MLVLGVAFPSALQAQNRDSVMAEALFNEGKRLDGGRQARRLAQVRLQLPGLPRHRYAAERRQLLREGRQDRHRLWPLR